MPAYTTFRPPALSHPSAELHCFLDSHGERVSVITWGVNAIFIVFISLRRRTGTCAQEWHVSKCSQSTDAHLLPPAGHGHHLLQHRELVSILHAPKKANKTRCP